MFALAQLMDIEKENWILLVGLSDVREESVFNAYGSLTHHFHPYIQLCLNSGNDQRCMIYQHIGIDPLDM